jgi:UDP-2,3-diacylglucosamine hydrolase
MSVKPIYVVSDVHLGAVSARRERAFVRWLDHAGETASEVVVNGDLFDFWFEYRSAIPRGHTRVLGALAALVDAGVPVRFMGGNHDWWGGSFLEQEIGLTLYREPLVLELAGRRTFLGHGDGLGRGDLGYRLLRLALRGRATRWAFRWLHPDVGALVAAKVSGTEGRVEGLPEAAKRRAAALEAWALAKLRAEPDLEQVILGHTHVPRLLEVEPGRFYVNAGDWVLHRSYVVLRRDEAPRLAEWEEADG